MNEEDEFIIEGLEETTEKINDLAKKLREARTIANELASSEIIINDKRQKDVVGHVTELRKEFIQTAGYEPFQFYLVAAGDSFEIHRGLNI